MASLVRSTAEPTVSSYNAVCSALAAAMRWAQVLHTLAGMRHLGARAEVAGYGAAVKACSMTRRWQYAVHLVLAMRGLRVVDLQALRDVQAAVELVHMPVADQPVSNAQQRRRIDNSLASMSSALASLLEGRDDSEAPVDLASPEQRVVLETLAGKLGAKNLAEALKVLKEPAQLIDAESGPRLLQSMLDKDAPFEVFVSNVEAYRRDRTRRIEAGDESAKLSFPKPQAKQAAAPAKVKQPAHPPPKPPAKAIPKQPSQPPKAPVPKKPREPSTPPPKALVKRIAKAPAKGGAATVTVAKAPQKRPMPEATLPLAKRPRPIGASAQPPIVKTPAPPHSPSLFEVESRGRSVGLARDQEPGVMREMEPGTESEGECRQIFDVWSWNFDAEFGQLLAALSSASDGAVLALDTEFPGFLREEKQTAKRSARYAALRQNCDNLRPIQLGISVSHRDGSLCGTWCFNLSFDVYTDLYTEASVAFLTAAGLDFPRHAAEGIDPAKIGRKLRASPLVGQQGCKHRWVTFQGWYDFGYMLRLLTHRRLPPDYTAFEELRSSFFTDRYELRDELPRGSLDSLLRDFGVERYGTPHTAGSDALATLELFFEVTREGPKRFLSAASGGSEASTAASAYMLETGSGYFQDSSGYSYGQGGWNDEVGHIGSDVAPSTGFELNEMDLQGESSRWNEGAFMSVDVAVAPRAWDEAPAPYLDSPTGTGQWPLLSTPSPGPPMQAQAMACPPQPMACQAPPIGMEVRPLQPLRQTKQPQDDAQAVLAAAGAGMAAALLEDPVEQQTQQEAAMQSLLMP
ncbi:caf1, partial [Symbiodinium necroappetens]